MKNQTKFLRYVTQTAYHFTLLLVAFLLMVVAPTGCQRVIEKAGPLKVMFTGDVGGRLDPCG
jgi:hypothetical protein